MRPRDKKIGLFKKARAVLAAYEVVQDPNRLDRVLAIADTSEPSPLMIEKMRGVPAGALAFEERPLVYPIDTDALERLPDGSVGRAYAEFLASRQLDAGSLKPPPVTTEASYMRRHLRETHDLWHVATGFDTDVAGELGLQGFYIGQFQSELGLFLSSLILLQTLLHQHDETERRLDAFTLGYAMGKEAEPLFGVRWRDWFPRPLDELRAHYRLAWRSDRASEKSVAAP